MSPRTVSAVGGVPTTWMRGGEMTKRICTVDGCERHREGRGLCSKHYQAWRRNGDPLVRRRNPAGEGGLDTAGYRVISCPGHPLADCNGRAREHRVIAWDAGLFDDPTLEVHHRNGDKVDNRPENLQPITKAAHTALHHG